MRKAINDNRTTVKGTVKGLRKYIIWDQIGNFTKQSKSALVLLWGALSSLQDVEIFKYYAKIALYLHSVLSLKESFLINKDYYFL